MKDRRKRKKSEFVGQLGVAFAHDTRVEQYVYCEGKNYFLGNLSIHPSNQGRSIAGCIRELESIHKKAAKGYTLTPSCKIGEN
jgi:hypothetical protein